MQDVLKVGRHNYSTDQEIHSFEGILCLMFPKLINCVHFKVSREHGIGPTSITFLGILVEEFTSILL